MTGMPFAIAGSMTLPGMCKLRTQGGSAACPLPAGVQLRSLVGLKQPSVQSGRSSLPHVLSNGDMRHDRSKSAGAVCHAHAEASAVGVMAVSSSADNALAHAVAALLGYAVLIGSCFRSIPQIAKVWKSRSAEGLSVLSNITQLMCYTIIVAYNVNMGYPFNTYGETFACWVQDVLLVGLIFKFTGVAMPIAMGTGLLFAAVSAWMFWGGCPLEVLSVLQFSTIFVMAFGSRLPQIVMNHRRGNSGVLSFTSCLLNVLGNAARIFTTFVVTQDMLLLVGVVTQGILNSILLYQVVNTKLASRQRTREFAALDGDNGLASGGMIPQPQPI